MEMGDEWIVFGGVARPFRAGRRRRGRGAWIRFTTRLSSGRTLWEGIRALAGELSPSWMPRAN